MARLDFFSSGIGDRPLLWGAFSYHVLDLPALVAIIPPSSPGSAKAERVTSPVLFAPNRTSLLARLFPSSSNTGKMRTVSKKKRFFYFLIKAIGKPNVTVPFR
jgi:hypothetical protein